MGSTWKWRKAQRRRMHCQRDGNTYTVPVAVRNSRSCAEASSHRLAIDCCASGDWIGEPRFTTIASVLNFYLGGPICTFQWQQFRGWCQVQQIYFAIIV